MTSSFNHEDMVANILLYRAQASAEQVEAGKGWYPKARAIIGIIADATGTEPRRVCYALSALSPRNPWRWNVADAYAFAEARAEGRTMPRATTFKRNWLAAWRALDGNVNPWAGAAPKVNAFVSAIMGDSGAVVVDTWAVRVATGGSKSRVNNDDEYAKVAAAYTEAARQLGEAPRDVQAITWLVAQTEGLATHRRGRHDLAFKAGTSPIIVELLSGIDTYYVEATK